MLRARASAQLTTTRPTARSGARRTTATASSTSQMRSATPRENAFVKMTQRPLHRGERGLRSHAKRGGYGPTCVFACPCNGHGACKQVSGSASATAILFLVTGWETLAKCATLATLESRAPVSTCDCLAFLICRWCSHRQGNYRAGFTLVDSENHIAYAGTEPFSCRSLSSASLNATVHPDLGVPLGGMLNANNALFFFDEGESAGSAMLPFSLRCEETETAH